MKTHILIPVLTLLAFAATASAQSIKKPTFASSGGTLGSGNERVAFTIGESIVGTISSSETLALGFWAGVAWEALLSVELMDQTDGFRIFPNPVSSTLFLKIPLQFRGTATIYASDGNMIKNIELQEGADQQVDLSTFASGLYIIAFTSSEGEQITLRILKN